MLELLPLTQRTVRVNYRRQAKQKSIYKRLNHIRDIISSNGSRTKVQTLVNYIERTFTEAQTSHDQLMDLIPEESEQYDEMWIENIRIDIDICLSEVEEYLESRLLDPASDQNSWASSLNLTTDDDINLACSFHLASLRSNVEKKSPDVQDISLVPLVEPNVDVAENRKGVLSSKDSRPPSQIISEAHKMPEDHTNILVANIPNASTPLKDKSTIHSEHLKHHQENDKTQSTHNEAT